MLEFDLAIVSLAVSRKGSVLDLLIVISREIGLKILGIKLISALDQCIWGSKLPLQVNSLLRRKPENARVKAALNVEESTS